MRDKGNRWEREAKDILNKKYPNTWKRIPGSGAIGTIIQMPSLTSDLMGRYYFIPIGFRGECKVGYGGKEMTLKKEWFDKIRMQAEALYDIPCVVLKFENSRSGTRYVIAFDFDAWDIILDSIETLYNENIKLRERLEESKTDE